MLVVQQVAVIDGPKWFFEPRRAIFPDSHQAVGKTLSPLAPNPFEPLADRHRDRGRQTLAG
jgi:hypothetical protein